jgi:uncharacterized protein YndB with AHSA1/START domain
MVEAPIEEVWKGFTTKEGLIKSWRVALAEADFRLGGAIRTNYNKDGAIGDEGTITHRIISFEPLRMISLKTEAPANAPASIKLICRTGWDVMRFEPLSPTRTRVTVTMMGYGEGPEYDQAYAFFRKGNDSVMNHLMEAYRPSGEEERSGRAYRRIGSMAGGEWVHEKLREGGKAFRARTVVTPGPGGKSFVARGWLGDETGMFEHAADQVWMDPDSKQVRFLNLDQEGTVATGSITAPGEETLVWEWNQVAAGGAKSAYRLTMTFAGADEYRMVLERPEPDGGARKVVDAVFRRVQEAPEPFRKLRPAR